MKKPIAYAVYLPDTDYMTTKKLFSPEEIKAVEDQTDPDVKENWVVIISGKDLEVILQP